MKKVFALVFLFSLSAQAYDTILQCQGGSKKNKNLLSVKSIVQIGDYGQRGNAVLQVTDSRGTIYFGPDEFDITPLRYHKVLLGDNGKQKARIVVNDRGLADVTIQEANGRYSTLRKVISCKIF